MRHSFMSEGPADCSCTVPKGQEKAIEQGPALWPLFSSPIQPCGSEGSSRQLHFATRKQSSEPLIFSSCPFMFNIVSYLLLLQTFLTQKLRNLLNNITYISPPNSSSLGSQDLCDFHKITMGPREISTFAKVI